MTIPRFSKEVYQDTPLPESFAKPYNKEEAPPIEIAERRFGQHLEGDMIPKRQIQIMSSQIQGTEWGAKIRNVPGSTGRLAINTAGTIASGGTNTASAIANGGKNTASTIATAGGTLASFVGKEGERFLNHNQDLSPAERIPLLGHAVQGLGSGTRTSRPPKGRVGSELYT